MNKRISQFPQISARNENDWILIEEATTGAYKKIKVADFVANLSSGTGGTQPTDPQSNVKDLNYVSDGDANGVFYWLGTDKLTTSYQNPATTGKVSITASNIHENHVATNLTDRTNKLYHSGRITDAFYQFDLIDKTCLITHYTLKGRSDFDGHHPRNWVLLGSIDGSTWVNLDTVTNSSLPTLNTWYSKSIAGQTTYYRFFKILQMGSNSSREPYLTCGEFEIYGQLKG